MGRSRRSRRTLWIVTVTTFLALSLLAGAVVTDQRARTAAHNEGRALVQTQLRLTRTRVAAGAVRYARGLAGGQLESAERALSATQGELSLTQLSLTATDHSEFLQGLDIGTINTCLNGIKGAYDQISANDRTAATQDISGVSSDCLTVAGVSSGGLVYPFDFPDPFVLRVGDTYFAYATNSAEGNIQIITSTDLVHWSAVGNALPQLPNWAAPDATWAPSVWQVGGTFVLYYSAVVAGPNGGEQCISAATAAQPQGPFVDDSTSPLECQPGQDGSIDPSPFVDSDGTPYLQWKSNGAGGQPATIWSEQLDASGTGFAAQASPARLLVPSQSWQGGVVEAPDLVLVDGRYLLFYSANQWNSDRYAVGVAACDGPLGPCSEAPTAPILSSGAQMAGPGGEAVFTDASGNWWMAFDAWIPGAVGYPHSRVLYVRQLSFSNGTPTVGAVSSGSG
jgi:hypothetical protein